jgi:PAS domain S-box-containing protein
MRKKPASATSPTVTPLEQRSKQELVRELEKLQRATRRLKATAREPDRERLIHDLQVHQVELEMQARELRESQVRLEEATSRYADLYDFAPVGYCILDPKGQILEINLTAATLLRVPRDRLVGRSFSTVAPLEDRRALLDHLRRCAEVKGRVTSEIALSGGSAGTRVLQLVSNPVRVENGERTAFRTILVDISDLKALENRLRLLAEAGERLTSSLDFVAVLETAARSAVPALADVCMIDVRSEGALVERPVVLFADPKKQERLADRLKSLPQGSGREAPQTRVIASGEPMLLPEMSRDQRLPVDDDDPHTGMLRSAGIRSLMVVPLSARGRTFGALTLAAAESERRFAAADLRLAQDLANRAAMAADNSRLYDEAERANAMLRVSEAKASGIVAISADAIISVDEEQRITLWNDGAERTYGYSRAEAIGAPLDMLIPERLRDSHRAEVAAFAAGPAVAGKMAEHGMTVGLRKDGEEFPTDATISRLHVGGQRILTVAVRDMTEQKRIEREQRVLAELGKVLSSNPDYEHTLTNVTRLVARALADFCVLYIVDEAGNLLRARTATREASMSWFTDIAFGMPAGPRPQHLVRQIIATRKPILTELTPDMMQALAHDEEHLRALELVKLRSLIGVPLSVGETCFGALLFESSTRQYGPADLQLAEEIGRRTALLIENARLHRAARAAIQARDDVLGIVAHDLRNPLLTIQVEARILQSGGRLTESVDLIERAARRMNRLIRDLLDVARGETAALAAERTVVSVANVVSDFIETQTPLTASRSLELKFELLPNLGEVFADRDRLLQVLENLLMNAEKVTKPGGRITVGAAPRDGEVIFWVADTGSGIDEGELPHLFEQFWRARRPGSQSAGLGLTIVKRIVEAHGGRVWAESRAGVGSTFYFTLPRGAARAVEARADMPQRSESRESTAL